MSDKGYVRAVRNQREIMYKRLHIQPMKMGAQPGLHGQRRAGEPQRDVAVAAELYAAVHADDVVAGAVRLFDPLSLRSSPNLR